MDSSSCSTTSVGDNNDNDPVSHSWNDKDKPQSVDVEDAPSSASDDEMDDNVEDDGSTDSDPDDVFPSTPKKDTKSKAKAKTPSNSTNSTPKSTKVKVNTNQHGEYVIASQHTNNDEPSSQTSSPKPPSSNKKSTPSKKRPNFIVKNSSGKYTYLVMVHDAIQNLADRSGSSIPAITKFIKAKHDYLNNVHPNKFKQSINTAIKAGLKEKRFLQIKNSYKINSEWIKKETTAFHTKEAQKRANERKKKKEIEKLKAEQKKLKDEQERKEREERKRIEEEERKKKAAESMTEEEKQALELKRLAKEEAERKKAEAIAREKEIAERIKKRRFPMDDIELIAEDNELGVKRPEGVTKPPFLPYALSYVVPIDDRPTGKKATPASVINACTSSMNRGLISDMLQVYHFYRGDVGFGRMYPGSVAPFTLQHLVFAVNEVVNGNAKRAKAVPPLISHLFMASLRLITGSIFCESEENVDDGSRISRKLLNHDLSKLDLCLNSTSWGEVSFCYMDMMERIYTTDASCDPNILPGDDIVINYVSDGDDDNDENMDSIKDNNSMTEDEAETPLPNGYYGYLGPPNSALHKAFTKLLRYDPWHHTAEELMAMLRSFTDDIIANDSELSKDIESRDSEIFELLKAKKAAESLYRKMRLAFEGPKYPSKSKASKSEESATTGEENAEDKTKENKEKEEEKKFKPTVSKRAFESSVKEREKAIDAYEKGMQKLVSRSEPIGYDRNRNAVYFFIHDPDCLYVEVNRPTEDPLQTSKTWHIIDNKSLFDDFVSSLDVRGIRELDLHDALTGTQSGRSSLRRYLADDQKKRALIQSWKRQEEEFFRRIENAKISCAIEEAGESRRSGRLASNAKDDLAKIESELEKARLEFEREIKNLDFNYSSLTGLDILFEYEKKNKIKDSCRKLWPDSKKGSDGAIGDIVSNMLDLENMCENLSPWIRDDVSRGEWISLLSKTVTSWQNSCLFHLGPKEILDDDSESSPQKKQRRSNDYVADSVSTLPQTLSALKEPLLSLEARIFTILGLEKAVQEVDEAGENMSVTSDDSQSKRKERLQEKANLAWKKKIHSLHNVPTKRASHIRDVLISAIAIARKGHLSDVLEDLRSALQMHRPGAAGRARASALSILEKYGNYEVPIMDGVDVVEDDESEADFSDADSVTEKDSEPSGSLLCAEAMMLTGCLDGDNNADRVDWKDAVAQCKTLSRFSALLEGLNQRAAPRLAKLKRDRDTLLKGIDHWEAKEKVRGGKAKKSPVNKFNSATELWADAIVSDEFVMSKVEGYPWWPARICVAKDASIAESLKALNRVLISFVGEQHLHVVEKLQEIRPFTGEMIDDGFKEYPPDVSTKLSDSIDMTRRILRGRGVKLVEGFQEEKKSSC